MPGVSAAIKWAVLGTLLSIYYLAPWLRWDRGPNAPDQALLVDMGGRRAYFFWIEIWPQEVYYLTGLLILGAIGLFLVTSVAGRVWCGFTCPQTVWTDLYMLVERWIEGDRNRRMKLDQEKWSARKLGLKLAKHGIWLLIAFATGGAWIMYFNDAPTVVREIFTGQASSAVYGFTALFATTTYLLAGWAREQVCIYMCPWPRFQSAMFDEHSLLVTYADWRGEKRGHAKRGEDFSKRGHCIDCHFTQDVHGNTKLYGEVRAAIEINCTDCHGSAGTSVIDSLRELHAWRQAGAPPRHPNARVGMRTTGPAADPVSAQNPLGGRDLLAMRTPDGKPRFEVRLVTRPDKRQEYALIQRAMVEHGREWEVKQTKDTIDPNSYYYNRKSHMAKTVRWEPGEDKLTWGGQLKDYLTDFTRKDNVDGKTCAHQSGSMSCMTCHSSWNPSCFGCHLPQKANKKAPSLHNEGDISRNLVAYNFQTLRDDVFMLARDGLATGNKINPARSSCAIHVTSYNGNRETIYHQQQTISGSGMSGIAFSTNVPHTVRGAHHNWETCSIRIAGTSRRRRSCTDCHMNRSRTTTTPIMAQLLMHGHEFYELHGQATAGSRPASMAWRRSSSPSRMSRRR